MNSSKKRHIRIFLTPIKNVFIYFPEKPIVFYFSFFRCWKDIFQMYMFIV
jgi:hypothetical protein